MRNDRTSEPTVRRLGPADVDAVLAAPHLFDEAPRRAWTERFLATPDHLMLLAAIDGDAVGFLTAIEIGHPDKAPELLLYELGVDEAVRRRGIGRQLVDAALAHARLLGMRAVWVPFDPDNEAARATYHAAGGFPPEDAAIVNWELSY